MSAHTKKRLTKDDITILVRGQELQLKSSVKKSLASIINELVESDTFSAKETHGNWLENARLRAAKYIKGARKREGLTQEQVYKKTGIRQSNLSAMEAGKRPIPKDLISKLCKLYGIKKKMIDEDLIIVELKAS